MSLHPGGPPDRPPATRLAETVASFSFTASLHGRDGAVLWSTRIDGQDPDDGGGWVSPAAIAAAIAQLANATADALREPAP